MALCGAGGGCEPEVQELGVIVPRSRHLAYGITVQQGKRGKRQEEKGNERSQGLLLEPSICPSVHLTIYPSCQFANLPVPSFGEEGIEI